ncbi:MAG: ABC transporter ATP-binding protein [Paracoccaceae bacterium]
MTVELRAVTLKVGAETHIYETTLALEPGGFNVLLGATGAGKTTLIKMLAGLERPTSGSVWMNGRDVTKDSPQKRNVSLVHQFFINYPNLNVYENIASPLRVAGMAKAEIEARVMKAAGLLRLTPMLKRRPHELSGGQQQRTALARAIVKDSSLVLLDEPLANLDYKLREELRDQLPALFAGRNATVLYATSEPSEALLLGGHTATVHLGRVTQFGPTAETYRNPLNLTTADVFSDPPMNAAPVTKEGDAIRLTPEVSWPAAGSAAGLPDGRYTIGLRPHFISPADGPGVPVLGKVAIIELTGSESVAHFGFGGVTWVAQSDGVHPYKVGTEHQFRLDASRAMYFDEAGKRVA